MSNINIITSPTIRLVGRLTIDDQALNDFLVDEGVENWTTDTDIAAQKLVEVGGRLCYKSYAKPRPGGNAAYIDHILSVGHGSVTEHAVYNFIITGVSRSLTHELVRHRAGFAYSQRSQRYCDESEVSFVVPPLYAEDVANAMRFFEDYRVSHSFSSYADTLDRCGEGLGSELAESNLFGLEWLTFMEQSQFAYARLSERTMKKLADEPDKTLRRKKAREAARSVLPNATETQIFVTLNARSARHFIEARGDAAADAEISRLAIAMLRILQMESPNLFGDYTVHSAVDGSEFVTTPYRKV